MSPNLPPIDPDYAVGLLTDLVRINSVNPMTSQGAADSDGPGPPGESRIAARLAEAMMDLGAEVEITPAEEAGEEANV